MAKNQVVNKKLQCINDTLEFGPSGEICLHFLLWRKLLYRCGLARIEQQSTGLLHLTVRILTSAQNKTADTERYQLFCGGGGRIRTIEAIRSRFTVCPLWPLGNSPI